MRQLAYPFFHPLAPVRHSNPHTHEKAWMCGIRKAQPALHLGAHALQALQALNATASLGARLLVAPDLAARTCAQGSATDDTSACCDVSTATGNGKQKAVGRAAGSESSSAVLVIAQAFSIKWLCNLGVETSRAS